MRVAALHRLILLLACVLLGAAFCSAGAAASSLTGDPAGQMVPSDIHSAPLHDAQFLVSESSRNIPTSASVARRFALKMMSCLQPDALQFLGVPPLGVKFRRSCAPAALSVPAVNPPLLI